ncbi:hypothetical protein PAXRUDRAFT_18097 [Paxillus rubicundulus Ve08.2h10]|uniref:Uncharacterized protein n=1 Tax=Paxillus rubicundulus Ve08.2h10 TaxID=930991 RepID=A0A0D0BZT3_9AGAM|nr:hypothetical protein PAXRUDRAFT_18097 [Paxillus rubicundulus Ve08.2h10]
MTVTKSTTFSLAQSNQMHLLAQILILRSVNEELRQEEEALIWGAYQIFFISEAGDSPGLSSPSRSWGSKSAEPGDELEWQSPEVLYEWIQEKSDSDSSSSAAGGTESTDHDDAVLEDDLERRGQDKARDYSYEARRPPSIKSAQEALRDINLTLKPPRNTGHGHKDTRLPLSLRTRLEWMASFLWIYTDFRPTSQVRGSANSHWTAASLQAAHAQQSNPWQARNL